jgi:hypothetical protein
MFALGSIPSITKKRSPYKTEIDIHPNRSINHNTETQKYETARQHNSSDGHNFKK